MKVYLAGPIANMSDEATHGWRDTVRILLKNDGIDVLDPAMLRDFRGVPYPGDLAVVEPDKADIDASDVLLAYTHVPSVGTSMEILYAWERGKFVVVIHPDPAHCSPWIHYHAHDVVPTIFLALQAIEAFRKDPTAWTLHDEEKLRTLGYTWLGQTARPSYRVSEIKTEPEDPDRGQDAQPGGRVTP